MVVFSRLGGGALGVQEGARAHPPRWLLLGELAVAAPCLEPWQEEGGGGLRRVS